MTKKIYNFDVPVSGRETFSVIASNYEEALEKINKEEYEQILSWKILNGILVLVVTQMNTCPSVSPCLI